MVMQGGCVIDRPAPGGGIIHCDCDCHQPIGEQRGIQTSCEHCRVLGGGVYTGMLEPDPDEDD